MEANIIQNLIAQVPSAAAVIVVVMLFLKSLEKRDAIFYDQMSKLTDRINAMEDAFIKHDTRAESHYGKMDDAIADMKHKVRKKIV